MSYNAFLFLMPYFYVIIVYVLANTLLIMEGDIENGN